MYKGDSLGFINKLPFIKMLIFLFFYRSILDVWYVNAVAGIFVGYPDATMNWGRLIASTWFCLAMAFIYPRRWLVASDIYFSILIVGVAIPMSSIYAWADFGSSYFFVVAITLVFMRVVMFLPRVPMPFVSGAERPALFFAVFAATLTLLWLVYATKASFVFDFANLYEQRISNRDFVTAGVWGYVISWTSKVIVPLMISFSLFSKRYVLAVSWFIFQIIVFSLSTQKFILLVGAFPFFCYCAFKSPRAPVIFLWSVILFFVVFYFIYLWTDSFWVSALAVQRPVFKPSLLNFEYFHFFSKNPHVMLSNSIFSPFFDNPYTENPAFLIGEMLKGTDETRSNTAFLGTGFAHFGYVGVFVFGLVVAFVLRLIDSATNGVPLWVAISVTFGGVSSMLIAADLFPALNTHGVILSIIMLAVLRRKLLFSARIG